MLLLFSALPIKPESLASIAYGTEKPKSFFPLESFISIESLSVYPPSGPLYFLREPVQIPQAAFPGPQNLTSTVS